MQIIILRHGKPAFELKGNARGNELGEIVKSYDRSGIVGIPPEETIAAIRGRHIVVCSHLVRSVESAKALGCQEVHLKDPLFCEAVIPYFEKGSIPLPIGLWVVILRLMWLLGFSRNGESLLNTQRRAKKATARLIELAEQHQNVLLVGHGFINHFIARELRKRGWSGPSRQDNEYWGYGIYERAAT